MTPAELNEKFSVGKALRFETAPGGLTRAVISTPLAEAQIYPHGAHIAHWAPRGHRPMLFMSSRSVFEPGKAIRGGVPIVFPWFGPRSDGKPGPAHGYARTSLWEVESAADLGDEGFRIALLLPSDDVRFTATFGTKLEMSLEVPNHSDLPLHFEEALHSYFSVSDIRDIAVQGLEGTTYIDQPDGFSRKVQPDEPIRFAKETDQVHLNTTSNCTIADPGWNRSIVIRKTGSQTTVVWNPWVAKTATLNDMAPDEWQRMVCVETANARDNAITLLPGESHRLTTAIFVE